MSRTLKRSGRGPGATVTVCAVFATLVVGAGGCAPGNGDAEPSGPAVEWALALHGGAGTISRTVSQERKDAYLEALTAAVDRGREMLDKGEPALDVVETVIRMLEDDPLFNAGKGAVFNHQGEHELDASIMDGRDLSCGAVAGVRTVKNPISLARLVMERTSHVLLAGPGADAFARETEVERVDQDYFYTERRHEAWRDAQEKGRDDGHRGTVGVAALDRDGNLAAGTSTGGMTNKKFGRVGDSPIVGAGTYADNRTCAISATGKGEEFIRNGVAHSVSAMMEHAGVSLGEAARAVIRDKLAPGDGGIIAVSHTGEIAMEFNTTGMFRGAADSTGRVEARIWE